MVDTVNFRRIKIRKTAGPLQRAWCPVHMLPRIENPTPLGDLVLRLPAFRQIWHPEELLPLSSAMSWLHARVLHKVFV